MSMRRVVAGLLAMMLGAAVLSVLPGAAPASGAADPAASGSAVTVSGRGDFAGLNVTVSQTKNLINQVVKVSWTGGTPSNHLDFFVNYLQIMQCWGDDPGPDRTQCQFGASTVVGEGWATVRQVNYGSLVDNNEELKKPEGSLDQAYVPFWAAGRPKPPPGPATSNSNQFFDSQVTNEIPLARTRDDGNGEEFFEVQTVRQAAGLGCGEPITTGGTTTGRSCWLVIVPRGTKEVDGLPRDGLSSNSALISSPLSQSNWGHRIVIPLQFQPVERACPIGVAERPLVGHELTVDAVTSWQPVLCANGATPLNYTQLTDDVARTQVPDGRLALVTNPIPPDQAPEGGPLVYAPVGLSGLAIAFNIDHQPPRDAREERLRLNGRRFTSMKLTPRLVAKLLTQSYRNSVTIQKEVLNSNPLGLLFDEEFLNLNPEYQGFAGLGQPVPDALVQLNGADITALLWSWVKADPEASAFLAGTPDPFGMRINPLNQGLALPTSTFPRNDDSCGESTNEYGVVLRFCTLDAHPFTNDMHDSGRAASRGDTKAKTPYANPGEPPNVRNVDRQGAGRRGLLAVVDAATAARYGLPTAQLRNAAGEFVAPTPESLLAGQAAMKSSAVTGVLASDPPGAGNPEAYPLTALSYAVAAPAAMDAAAGKDYAAFLRHAAGPGQQPGLAPGQLPPGMAPLPDPLKAQTLAAATTIEALTASRPPGPPPPTTVTTTVPTENPIIDSNPAADTDATATNPSSGRPAATLAAVSAPVSGGPPATPRQPVEQTGRTPSLSAFAVGRVLVALLIVGALAASAPVRHLLRGGLRQLGLRRFGGKEVTPTEQ